MSAGSLNSSSSLWSKNTPPHISDISTCIGPNFTGFNSVPVLGHFINAIPLFLTIKLWATLANRYNDRIYFNINKLSLLAE
jgi:hypothetical protein